MRGRIKKIPQNVTIIGPLESPLKKLRNRFRWQVLLKAPEISVLKSLLNEMMQEPIKVQKDELLQIDVDPHHLI